MDLEARIEAVPPVIRHMVRTLLALDERHQAMIANMGDFGGVEIHWDRGNMSLYPRHRLVTFKRDALEADSVP